jgi:hypothetical protein
VQSPAYREKRGVRLLSPKGSQWTPSTAPAAAGSTRLCAVAKPAD